MNITEKILASHSSQNQVVPGDIIESSIDLVMVHEQLGGRIAPEFEKLGEKQVWDPRKIFFILDHWTPPPDMRAAKMHQIANKFAQNYKIFWNFGMREGICHQVLPEKGFAIPGNLIVGSDSHTTTYGAFNCFSTGIGATDVVLIFNSGKLWFKVPESIRVDFIGKLSPFVMGKDIVLQMLADFKTDGAIYDGFEFGGSGLSNITIDSRMTIANMTVEMGAKSGIFEGDTILHEWLITHQNQDYHPKAFDFVKPTKDAQYKLRKQYDLSQIVPLVARPYSPDNVIPVMELPKIEVDQAFLGSCTNGRMEDLRLAARIVKGHRIPSRVRFIVIPASKEIYLQALNEGILETLIHAGAMVEYPTCGPCIGAQMGLLGPNEVCISSSNRNFQGRMGDPSAKVYLASSAVVAASAITGFITVPDKNVLEEK